MSSCWLLGPQQVLAMLVLVLTDRQLSVAGAVQRGNKLASRLLGPVRMQLRLLVSGMLLPVLLAWQRGQEAPILLMLAPACPLPPVAKTAQRRKQAWVPLVPAGTQQGALQVLLPACLQLSATVWPWIGTMALVLEAPACLLRLMVASALRGCTTGTGRQRLQPLPPTRLFLPVGPALLEEAAARQGAAVRRPLRHRPAVLSGLLRGTLQA